MQGNLFLPPKEPQVCGLQQIPSQYFEGNEGIDADFFLVIGASTTGLHSIEEFCGSNTLAISLVCAWDPVSNRPIAGEINFCKFNLLNVPLDVESALHEIVHTLVRTTQCQRLKQQN